MVNSPCRASPLQQIHLTDNCQDYTTDTYLIQKWTDPRLASEAWKVEKDHDALLVISLSLCRSRWTWRTPSWSRPSGSRRFSSRMPRRETSSSWQCPTSWSGSTQMEKFFIFWDWSWSSPAWWSWVTTPTTGRSAACRYPPVSNFRVHRPSSNSSMLT